MNVCGGRVERALAGVDGDDLDAPVCRRAERDPFSALASGTDVAITFALEAIAALMPATCLATSLFA